MTFPVESLISIFALASVLPVIVCVSELSTAVGVIGAIISVESFLSLLLSSSSFTANK